MEQDGSNPIRINCVILNFNDGETVSRLVHMIHDYDYLEKIVLVDNHSTDDSWEQLQVLKDEKVDLIRTEKNGSLYKCGALWVGCSGAKMVGESACPASGGYFLCAQKVLKDAQETGWFLDFLPGRQAEFSVGRGLSLESSLLLRRCWQKVCRRRHPQ